MRTALSTRGLLSRRARRGRSGSHLRRNPIDWAFDICNVTLCLLLGFATLYPFVLVFSTSISQPIHVVSNRVWLWPVGFSLRGYGIIFRRSAIWLAYFNTLIYTAAGTAQSLLLTLLAGYALSRSHFVLRRPLTWFFTLTMFFGGGLVPFFVLINTLGLYNTRWAIILPSGAAAYYIVMARTFFQGIPESLYESARIDGASDWRIMLGIYFPLSKPIIAVLTLYYAVGQWNAYFNAMIFLTARRLQPLQLYLKQVLLENSGDMQRGANLNMAELSLIQEQLKYCMIVVAILPILLFYPYLQKYFVKGVMVGAIKG